MLLLLLLLLLLGVVGEVLAPAQRSIDNVNDDSNLLAHCTQLDRTSRSSSGANLAQNCARGQTKKIHAGQGHAGRWWSFLCVQRVPRILMTPTSVSRMGNVVYLVRSTLGPHRGENCDDYNDGPLHECETIHWYLVGCGTRYKALRSERKSTSNYAKRTEVHDSNIDF